MSEIGTKILLVSLVACTVLSQRMIIGRKAIPFNIVRIDLLSTFIESVSKNSYLFIMVDGFIKFVIAKPTWTIRVKKMVARVREVFGE